MAVVRRSGKKPVSASDLSREQDRVPVKRKEGILQPGKYFKVLRLCHADGSPVKVLAPDQIIGAVNSDQPGIIGVTRHEFLSRLILKMNLLLLEVPMDAVRGAAQINKRDSVFLFSPEHPDESIPIGRHGAVEYSGHSRDRVPADDRILRISPDRNITTVSGFLLPGHIRNGGASQYLIFHISSPPQKSRHLFFNL